MISTEFRRKSRQRLKQKLASINIKKSDTELIRFVMNQGVPVIDSENPQPYSVKGNVIYLNFHEAQKKVWNAKKRHVVALGGTQSGKTSIAPVWLLREIQKRGAGDYLFISPSYPLLSKKALPEIKRLFTTKLGLGKYVSGEKKILTINRVGEIYLWGKRQEIRTQIFFGHAQDPESLESATAKAAVLDEVGQKQFKQNSFEAVQRRLAIHQGRILMPTTPYYLGWLKKMFWDVWQSANGNHPEIDIIRFRSIDNPSFPMSEYENAKATLPRWKFDMFYNALFTKAAGMIYDCFDEKMHVVPAFNIPNEWKKRFLGLDFGGINTAGIFIARDDSTGKLYIYREYLAGSRTAKQHKSALLDSEPITPISAGGSKSEEQWRNEFRQAGMGILSPLISDVEVGINAVYGAFKTDKLVILDSCPMLIDELLSYSRVLDDTGQPTEAIEDKNSYHLCDALRYIVPYADRQNNFKVGY